MAYYRNRRSNGYKSYNQRRFYKGSKRRNRYTKAEKIAFNLGQEQRVRQSIKTGDTGTRVFEAFQKGYHGVPAKGSRKPLFSI